MRYNFQRYFPTTETVKLIFFASTAIRYRPEISKYIYTHGEDMLNYGIYTLTSFFSLKDNFNPEMSTDFFTNKNKKIVLGGKSINEILKFYKFNIGDFNPYTPDSLTIINKKKIKFHFLSYYLRWDPQEVYYYASQNTGFNANTERTQGTYSNYSSIDDKIDYFHYYTTLINLGLVEQLMMLLKR